MTRRLDLSRNQNHPSTFRVIELNLQCHCQWMCVLWMSIVVVISSIEDHSEVEPIHPDITFNLLSDPSYRFVSWILDILPAWVGVTHNQCRTSLSNVCERIDLIELLWHKRLLAYFRGEEEEVCGRSAFGFITGWTVSQPASRRCL